MKLFEASLGKKRLYFAIFVIYCVLGYEFTNKFQFFEPSPLPLMWVDKAIPLIPWTVWIYFSQYIYFFFGLAFIKHVHVMRKLMIAFFFCLTLSFLIFFFYPTTCPRAAMLDPTLSAKMLQLIWKIDAPFNCFPSLHVSLPFTMAFYFYEISRKQAIFLTLWSAAIAVSTLTTDQHYFVDVAGGVILAVIFVPFSSWLYSRLHAEKMAGSP
ncbi:MAG: phosphatase PAP2 family protein [Deltaproteobacteria bacterium]|nr:phosphatase PAP2 family protein [Deltaproteobacteria bacterium]